MTDDFSRYERLREDGHDASHVAHVGEAEGLDRITLIRMLRTVYQLSLSDVKRVLHPPDPWDDERIAELNTGAQTRPMRPEEA